MSPSELEDLRKRTSQQSDEDLLKIVNVDFRNYRKETIGLARAELEKRGVIQPPEPEQNTEGGKHVIAPSARHGRDNSQISDKSTVTDPSRSRQVSALMKRYKDAYIVATVTNGFGVIIKGIGAVLAVVLVLGGLMVVGNGRAGDATFAMGVVIVVTGIIAGVWFYIVGVLVSAQAQILKASLDSAVNSSPFLMNEHKAKVMSLPEA